MLCFVYKEFKQVLMRTKGIRQAESESPYTVKTKGAIWWKEGDSTALTLLTSCWDIRKESRHGCTLEHMEIRIFYFKGQDQIRIFLCESETLQREKDRNETWPPSFHAQQHSQLKQQVLLLFQMTH